jgi:hypothetical protein
MEVSEMLALIIRLKGKAIQQAMQQTCYTVLTGIINAHSKGAINDKILANCSMALAFLAAYSSDPQQMITLSEAFDESCEGVDAVLIPIKFGVLINGNDSCDKKNLENSLKEYLTERIVDQGGFEEVDDDPAPIDTESGLFRFKGVLSILTHLTNAFARRAFCGEPNQSGVNILYSCINESKCFEKLNSEEDIGADSYTLLLHILENIPVRLVTKGPDAGKFTQELAQVMRDALRCVQGNYLEF